MHLRWVCIMILVLKIKNKTGGCIWNENSFRNLKSPSTPWILCTCGCVLNHYRQGNYCTGNSHSCSIVLYYITHALHWSAFKSNPDILKNWNISMNHISYRQEKKILIWALITPTPLPLHLSGIHAISASSLFVHGFVNIGLRLPCTARLV